MKSKLFRGNFPRGKMKYHSRFICKEFWQKNHFTLLQEKESKLLYSFCIPFNEQQKCHVTNIYTERKNKGIILHSFARKTKVSYYITFFQTLLSLSCWNCNSKVETVQLNTEQFSKWRMRTDVSCGFHRSASLHANKMFLNGNAITDELPNIQFSSTTVRDTSLPGTFRSILFIRHGL